VTEFISLYLDESGGRGWPSPWGRNRYRYYVLAGCLLTPDQDRRAHDVLPEILTEFFPAGDGPIELHYGDLINNRNGYELLEQSDKLKLADRVWDFILELKPLLMGTVVDKTTMRTRYPSPHEPSQYAMRATIERFDKHLKKVGKYGMTIVDTQSFEKEMQQMVHESRKAGIKIGGTQPMLTDSNLENVLNSVVCCPSHMSPGVQIADFVAYAAFSHFERSKSRRYNQVGPLWRRAGRFSEPSVVPRSISKI